MHTKLWLENENRTYNWGNLSVDVRKILKCISNNGKILIGFMWLTIDPSVGLP